MLVIAHDDDIVDALAELLDVIMRVVIIGYIAVRGQHESRLTAGDAELPHELNIRAAEAGRDQLEVNVETIDATRDGGGHEGSDELRTKRGVLEEDRLVDVSGIEVIDHGPDLVAGCMSRLHIVRTPVGGERALIRIQDEPGRGDHVHRAARLRARTREARVARLRGHLMEAHHDLLIEEFMCIFRRSVGALRGHGTLVGETLLSEPADIAVFGFNP